MSHTSSVLSKTTNEDILKMDYFQALMLEGGLKNLSKQQVNEFSQKISLLQEHVKDLILNREAYKQRKIDQIAKKYCQNIPQELCARENIQVAKTNFQQAKSIVEEFSVRKGSKIRLSQQKYEGPKVQKSNQSKKVIYLSQSQQPSLLEKVLLPLFRKVDRYLMDSQDVNFTQKSQASPINEPQDQQEQKLLKPYLVVDYEDIEKNKYD